MGAAILALYGSPHAASAQSPVADGPSFRLLRANEDYSALARDAALEGWKRYKFIPLSDDRSVWLSVGGEARGRYERYDNDEWGDGPQDGNGYFSLRTLTYADLHAGEHLRLFGQVQTAAMAGRNGGPGPIDREDGDFHQLFLGITARPGAQTQLDLRLGRQEMQLGSGCLLSVREGAGTRSSFEGATLRVDQNDASVSSFWLRPVRQQSGSWDNRPESGRSLAGIFATLPLLRNESSSALDAYVLESRDAHSSFAGILGSERRVTAGGRLTYASKTLDSTLEMVGQVGQQGDLKIRAWFTAANLGWTWRAVPLSPRLALRLGLASGDGSPSDGRLGTFNALYPNLSYFGEIALLGPANLMDFHPTLTLTLPGQNSLTLGVVAYWRHKMTDGIYGPSLAQERVAGTSTARKVGNQFDAKLSWTPSDYVEMALSYATFRPGDFLMQTGSSKTVQYMNVEATWRF